MNATPQTDKERLFQENHWLEKLDGGGYPLELGAGTEIPTWLKDRLAMRSANSSNYAFGEDPAFVDEDGDGIDDREQEDGGPRQSAWQRTMNAILDSAIADIDRQIADNKEEIALTAQQIQDITRLYDQVTRERAELAPQIAAMREQVRTDQETYDKAHAATVEQTAKVADQTRAVAQKQTELTTQEAVVAQKTVEEQKAAQDLTAAKENTVTKTEEKAKANQDVGNVANTYLDNQANSTIGYTNENGHHVIILKKTGPDGKEYFVSAAGDKISEQDRIKLADANKNADGSTPSDTDLLSKAKTFDEDAWKQWIKNLQSAGNVVVAKDAELQNAQKDEQKAQSAWESAADSLKTETQKLGTLKQELSDEKTKLEHEQKELEQRQKEQAEAKAKLDGDKDKLAALEAKDAELAKKQEDLKAQKEALEQKQQDLIEKNKQLESAKDQLSDPNYRKKLEKMSPEQAAAEINKLPLSNEMKADLAAEISHAKPDDSPVAKGPTAIADASPNPASSTTQSAPIQIRPSSSAAKGAEPDSWPPSADKSMGSAFASAASPTPATPESAPTPATPTPDDELKNPAPMVAKATPTLGAAPA